MTGSTTDYDLTSFDGTKIRIHWFPRAGAAGAKSPTLLKGPGWGQPGDTNTAGSGYGLFGDLSIHTLQTAGYNVLTWDPRGFGQSGGTVESDSPQYEGHDVQRLIDWVAAQPGVQLDAKNDPRVGMVGASYGGAIQLVTAGIDCRVDAIVPQIAWHSSDRQRLELTNQLRLSSKRQVRVNPSLQRDHASFVQARDLALRERLVRKIRQRRPAPQRQPLAQQLAPAARVAAAQQPATLAHQRLEAVEVDRAGLGRQPVAVPVGEQHPLTERPAQLRHVPLHDLDRARRRSLPPHRLDQTIRGNHLTATQDQHDQQRPLLGTAESDRLLVLERLKRPEDSESDH